MTPTCMYNADRARGLAIRASAGCVGGRCSIPGRVTPMTYKVGGLRLSEAGQATDWQAPSQYKGLNDLFLLACGRNDSELWHHKTALRG